MPQKHPNLDKSKPKRNKPTANEPEKRVEPRAATAPAHAEDTHRETPKQRADWEGMTAKPRQTTATEEQEERDLEGEGDEAITLDMQGEGSYSGTRQYERGMKASLAEGKVGERAQAARKAIEGPDAEALRKAERIGKSGHPKRTH